MDRNFYTLGNVDPRKQLKLTMASFSIYQKSNLLKDSLSSPRNMQKCVSSQGDLGKSASQS